MVRYNMNNRTMPLLLLLHKKKNNNNKEIKRFLVEFTKLQNTGIGVHKNNYNFGAFLH